MRCGVGPSLRLQASAAGFATAKPRTALSKSIERTYANLFNEQVGVLTALYRNCHRVVTDHLRRVRFASANRLTRTSALRWTTRLRFTIQLSRRQSNVCTNVPRPPEWRPSQFSFEIAYIKQHVPPRGFTDV